MTATAYLEKYFDCVDALPLDLQRFVTDLREVERETQGLLVKVRRLECDLEEGRYGAAEEKQRRVLLQLQHCILKLREAGDEKLSVSSQLLDTVEDYTQQLALRLKVLDNPRTSLDDHHHTPRHSNASMHSTVKGESAVTTVCESTLEKSQGKKSISAKRQRSSDKSLEEEGVTALKESGGRSRENSTAGTAVPLGSGKPPKKKIKVKKKAVKEPAAAALPPPAQVPMPDLNSQPLDPDEPTYCLCNQVSFGEMIGCDNEECPIEWFHFQCVGLTSKPKGKWYCPQCSTDKKPRAAK